MKRGPGRPRKYLSAKRNFGKPINDDYSTISSPTKSYQMQSKVDECDGEWNLACRGADLSPPVLEPMCSSSHVEKASKNNILSPPTLTPSKRTNKTKRPYESFFEFPCKRRMLKNFNSDEVSI